MTITQSQRFPIDKIYVVREERQREELTDLDELLHSMNSIGLLNPLIIEADGKLRAGERRLSAAKLGGWTHIDVRFIEDLSAAELELVELEENIKRQQLPWLNECKAILKYHRLMKENNPEWGKGDTAEALGMSYASAQSKMLVAEEAEAGNQRVIEAPKLSVAKNVVIRTRERAKQSEAAAATALISGDKEPEVEPVPILHANFHEWAGTYDGPSFNFIHCDFPYGVDADQHDQGQAAKMGGYEDSKDVFDALLATLGTCMSRIVAPSAHLLFWFSMDYYEDVKYLLMDMGWRIDPFPFIWYKSDNTGILPDAQRGPRRVYETAFFGSRGDRKLTKRGARANTVAWAGRDKSIHMSEKPVGMLNHFFEMVVDEYSDVLDPTCGSANALKAATALGARRVLGLEQDEEFYQRAKEAYFDE